MWSLRHDLKIVLFHERVLLHSSDIPICCTLSISINFKYCGAVMSSITWVREHFWIHFLNHKSFNHETWSTTDKIMDNIFGKYSATFFVLFEDWVLIQTLFNLVTCCSKSKINFYKFVIFYSFEGVQIDNQNNKNHLIKYGRLMIILICSW